MRNDDSLITKFYVVIYGEYHKDGLHAIRYITRGYLFILDNRKPGVHSGEKVVQRS